MVWFGLIGNGWCKISQLFKNYFWELYFETRANASILRLYTVTQIIDFKRYRNCAAQHNTIQYNSSLEQSFLKLNQTVVREAIKNHRYLYIAASFITSNAGERALNYKYSYNYKYLLLLLRVWPQIIVNSLRLVG